MTRALIASLFASTGLVSVVAAQTPPVPAAASACERLVQTVEARRGETLPVTIENARDYRTAGDDAACREALVRLGDTAPVATVQAAPDGTPLRVDPSRIVVQQAAPTVQVQQAPPQVVVQQARPDVRVTQPRPEIIVRQPAPTVTVDIPQPEIIVRMPDPEVSVSMAQPQVEVRQPQPQVQIVQPQNPPQVAVAPVQAQVQVRAPEAQANVQVQGAEGRPEVRYERAEPRVVVNQPPGEPNVRVESAQNAPPPPAQTPAASTSSPAQPSPGVPVAPVLTLQQPAPGASAVPPVAPAPQTATAPAAPVPPPGTAESVPPVPIGPADTAARTAQQTPAAPAQGRQLSAEELGNMRVYSTAGDRIGEVDDVMIGPADQTFLVVTYGGFLGIGEREVKLPLSRMSIQDDRLVIDMSAEELRSQTVRQADAPGYRQAGADFRAPISLFRGADTAQAAYGTATAPQPPTTGVLQAPPVAGTQQVAVSRLKDLRLYTVQGQQLGSVERVVQGPDGGFRLVVAHGGFLGLGERRVLVPAAQVALREDRLVAQELTDDQLKALPVANRNDAVFREIDNEQQVPVGLAP
jgi:sporulation protein YlmC with PRC-barrel domain